MAIAAMPGPRIADREFLQDFKRAMDEAENAARAAFAKYDVDGGNDDFDDNDHDDDDDNDNDEDVTTTTTATSLSSSFSSSSSSSSLSSSDSIALNIPVIFGA